MSVEELPNYENAVRLAREARGIRTATGIGTRSKAGWKIESALEPHCASPQRPSGARRRAVLGLCVLLLAVFFLTRVHVHAHHASLVAAADVPAARIREVDDMRMANLAAIGALAVASGALAGDGVVPPGWMVFADSSTQMTNEQGENGWSYWFTTGAGSKPQQMQASVFVEAPSGYELVVWAPSPTVGCSTHVTVCHIFSLRNTRTGATSNVMHGNSTSCCTPQSGIQRPKLKWNTPTAIPARIEWFGQYSSVGGNNQPVTLDVNDQPIFVANEADFGTTGATLWFEAQSLSSVSLQYERCSPFDFKLRVLTPDCNGNSIADAVEIANQPEFDWNGDGILDFCQCPGDVVANGIVDGADLAALLSVWGTDGGIYPRADTNSDGFVDAQDLAAVLGGWGACP